MQPSIQLKSIIPEEMAQFRQMALDHFVAINPSFVPTQEWESNYIKSCLGRPNIYSRWIMSDTARAGFVIFLMERHPFVDRLQGIIREVYVKP